MRRQILLAPFRKNDSHHIGPTRRELDRYRHRARYLELNSKDFCARATGLSEFHADLSTDLGLTDT